MAKKAGKAPEGIDIFAYSWDIPQGEMIARFDGQQWGKSSNLYCYFTEDVTGEQYVLSAFRNDDETGAYGPRDRQTDFRNMLPGQLFRLYIGETRTGRTRWETAEPIPETK